MKQTLFVLLALAALAVSAGTVTLKSVRQRWPFGNQVDIDLYLDATGNQDVTLKATYDGQTTPVTLTAEQFEGSLNLHPGFNHLVWLPSVAGHGNQRLTGFSVTAELATFDARKYLVIDLKDRSWNYYSDDPDGSAWNDDKYKTRYMVFRRVPAGIYSLGMTTAQMSRLCEVGGDVIGSIHPQTKKARQICISKDYYISIYHLTDANATAISWAKTTTSSENAGASWTNDQGVVRTFYWKDNSSIAKTSLCQLFPQSWRGNPTNGTTTCLWPQDGHAVRTCEADTWGDTTQSAGSVVGRFRDLMTYTPTPLPANMVIDLPTQEMSEIAVRGGCETFLSDNIGSETSTAYDILNYKTNHIVWGKAANAGTKTANNWGIYDPLGIVFEATINVVSTNHCLSTWKAGFFSEIVTFDESQLTDPVGWTCPKDQPDEPLLMVLFNNGWSVSGLRFDAMPQFRNTYPVGSTDAKVGARLAIYLK